MAHGFVKATYPFSTNEPGEISLEVGDVVEVVSVVDSNWLKGKLDDKTGNFPVNFVEKVQLPSLSAGQKVFAAIKDFPCDTQGDLGFKKGDVIHGLHAVDQNWWKGRLGPNEGIFPIILTKELLSVEANVDTSHVSLSQQLSTELFKVKALVDCKAQLDEELGFVAGDIICVTKVQDDGWYYGHCGGQQGIFLPDLTEPLGSAPSALTVDAGQSRGKLEATQSSAFQAKPPTDVSVQDQNGIGYREKSSSFTKENTRSSMNSVEDGVTPYGRTLYPFTAEASNELSFRENEIVTLLCHVDPCWLEGEIDGRVGLLPANYVDIIVDCAWSQEQMIENSLGVISAESYAKEGSRESSAEASVSVLPVDSSVSRDDHVGQSSAVDEVYALVLYNYEPVNDGELQLSEGDTITILRQADEHWYEARLDSGQLGYCPISYVEVIGGGPLPPSSIAKVHDDVVSSNVENTIQTESHEKMHSAKDVEFKVSSAVHQNVEEKDHSTSYSQSSDDYVRQRPSSSIITSSQKPLLRPKPDLKPKPLLSNAASRMSAPVGHQERLSVELDDMIKAELHKANTEANQRLRSSSGEITENPTRSAKVTSQVGQMQQPSEPLSDYSALREAIDMDSGLAAPKSPSPKKGPPPRPVGPRVTATTLKAPLIPLPRNVPKPVPQRVAPSRPQQSTPPPRPMQSPVKPTSPTDRGIPPPRPRPISHPVRQSSITDPGLGDNEELIADLKRRKTEKQHDIENCKKAEQELRIMLANPSTTEVERVEIEENIEFYEANINGLTNELKHMNDELRHLQPGYRDTVEERLREEAIQKQMQQELVKKHMDTRERVIAELLTTEQHYLRDMQMCWDSFKGDRALQNPDGTDTETLFGNMNEVCEVSQKLLTSLESAVNGKDFNNQVIGACFIAHTEQMKKTYAVYCRNHDDVLALLEKYDDYADIQDYFNKGLQSLRQQSTVFDLGSVLIKPVQRILKYPLLLNELLKSTEEGHPDKQPLVTAIGAMTDVATAINEYKRRKDLAYKYRKVKEERVSDKMSKLTLHSIKKKSNRFSMRLSTNLGMGQQTRDEQFDREEMKFHDLERAVKSFLRDVGLYCEQLQDAAVGYETISDDLGDFYDQDYSTPEVQKYQETQRQLTHELFDQFKSFTEERVISPLNKLILLFQGPNNVIEKRNDKLLDYDSCSLKAEKVKDINRVKAAQDELLKAKNNYEAMNAQLLDELPRLYEIASTVFRQCVSNYLQAYKNFLGKALHNMYPLLEIPSLASSRDPLLETFSQEHSEACDQLATLSFIPKGFSSKARTEGKGRPSLEPAKQPVMADVQTPAQRSALLSAYSHDKIYSCIETYQSSDMMELTLATGTIVGVVKDQDPMGSKDRWFVDNGATKGFIPKRILSAYDPSKVEPASVTSLLGSGHAEVTEYMLSGSTIWYTHVEDTSSTVNLLPSTPPPSYQESLYTYDLSPSLMTSKDERLAPSAISQSPLVQRQSQQYYQALYTFEARTDNEVSIEEGQMVIMLEPHDQEGNPEWWLVATDRHQGYAPANYFSPCQS